MKAAVVKNVGRAHLFSEAQITPLHFEGWEHFTELKAEIENTFSNKIHW